MKIWKRNAVVATVLLFVCAGIYLNWSYNKDNVQDLTATLDSEQVMGESTLVLSESENGDLLDAASAPAEGMSSEDYFADVRLTRQASRDNAVELLQETMAYDSSDTTASAAMEELVDTALAEAQIESMLIAKGYDDCVTYMSEDGISVAVAAPAEGLSESDVALISDVVTSQSEYTLAQLRIIEVK